MPLFITDIILHKAVANDYMLLDKALPPQYLPSEANRAFLSEGKKAQYPAPPSLYMQYFRKGDDVSLPQVVNEVRSAISKTGKQFSFTVRKDKKH